MKKILLPFLIINLIIFSPNLFKEKEVTNYVHASTDPPVYGGGGGGGNDGAGTGNCTKINVIDCEDDITNTLHNLSSSGKGIVKSTETAEICVFCHTPHAAQNDSPLWNRKFSSQEYEMYAPMMGSNLRGSLDFTRTPQDQPLGFSKLCLSCHDGSIAIGNLINAPGAGGYGDKIFAMDGTRSDGTMPFGAGEFSGDTRRIGVDLRNDHPISFKMDQPVITADKELRDISNDFDADGSASWAAYRGVKLYPLDFSQTKNDAIQCTTCHNPHTTAEKFLRGNMYNTRTTDSFPTSSNQICVSCHVKPGWAGSTHDINLNEYRVASPKGEGKTVRAHGCMNCHDPHTSLGSDRLHRHGAGSNNMPAIENTCFQCHMKNDGNEFIPETNNELPYVLAPDIMTEFAKGRLGGVSGEGSSMPLDSNWYDNSKGSNNGTHQPIFISQNTLNGRRDEHTGLITDNTEERVLNVPARYSPPANSPSPVKLPEQMIHVECTDCHNPHQVAYENRLRGMKGITIDGNVIGADSGGSPPNGSIIKAKTIEGLSVTDYIDDRPLDPVTGLIEPLVYEICLRCHGDSFAYNMPRIALGASKGSMITPTISNSDHGPLGQPRAHRGHTGKNRDLGIWRLIGWYPNYAASNPSNLRFGASNKRLEFNPSTPSLTRINIDKAGNNIKSIYTSRERYAYLQYNSSYHPVAAPGRNGTQALCYQLEEAFPILLGSSCNSPSEAARALSGLTIQCTDCHNNDALGYTGNNAGTGNPGYTSDDGITDPTASGVISRSEIDDNMIIRGPVTGSGSETNKRSSDHPSNITAALTIDETVPQGPHGSANKRILRANYDTRYGAGRSSTRGPQYYRGDNSFALCFLCHEKSVFLANTQNATNFGGFYNNGVDLYIPSAVNWAPNLHAYHLYNTNATCHECHNNLHSNVEANNTIYGDGTGDLNYLPPADNTHDEIDDGYINTHLINFGPQAIGDNSIYPNWYYDSGVFRCNLVCHGVTMTACAYYTHSGEGQEGTAWGCGSGSQVF